MHFCIFIATSTLFSMLANSNLLFFLFPLTYNLSMLFFMWEPVCIVTNFLLPWSMPLRFSFLQFKGPNYIKRQTVQLFSPWIKLLLQTLVFSSFGIATGHYNSKFPAYILIEKKRKNNIYIYIYIYIYIL